ESCMTPEEVAQRIPTYRAINWSDIQDDKDLDVWNRLTTNFWLPEKLPLSNDLQSWANLTEDERDVSMKVFAGLTLLDPIQGTVGALSLIPGSLTLHEEAVLSNIVFMEAVHAKSYSSILSTLASTEAIENIFRWTREEPTLQYKTHEIIKYYEGD